jgi:hypothetical protein
MLFPLSHYLALLTKKSGIQAGLITLNFCRVNWGVFTIFKREGSL